MPIIALILILLALYALFVVVTTYWQGIILAIFAVIVLKILFYLCLYLPWLKHLQKSVLLYLPAQKRYIVPIEWKKDKQRQAWLVRYVSPHLYEGKLDIHEGIESIRSVKPISQKQASRSIPLAAMLKIAHPTQIAYQRVFPQITQLRQQINELQRLRNLAASSRLYGGKVSLYERAIAQCEQLQQNTTHFFNQISEYIEEVLIGAELAAFDPQSLPDPIDVEFDLQSQYSAIQEQFERLKVEVEIYSQLQAN